MFGATSTFLKSYLFHTMRRSLLSSSLSLLIVFFAHVRSEDLFPPDDASSLWSLDDPANSASVDLVVNPSDLDLDTVSIPGSFELSDPSDSSDDLFASDLSASSDLVALPACESEGILANDDLQAREERSCKNPDENLDLNLPVQLFQDPVRFLRDSLRTPPVGQGDRPTDQGSPEDEPGDSKAATRYPPNEDVCPSEVFGSSNIPVCDNPYTGTTVQELHSYALLAINTIPCRCSVSHYLLHWSSHGGCGRNYHQATRVGPSNRSSVVTAARSWLRSQGSYPPTRSLILSWRKMSELAFTHPHFSVAQ